ncbi:MAG: tRNA dihydrouridine synthase DusB [Hyphomicrobiaceae bacterium]
MSRQTNSGVPALSIGPLALNNPVILAPMSGVSDAPFRDLAQRLGAGLVVSEMIASEMLAAQRRDVVRKARCGASRPFVMQLAGREARWMAEGARIATDMGADVIDINMGCPAREVTGKLSGSALMRDPDHASQLIEAVVSATDLPVTLKMRLGWDRTTLNAADIARRAEALGVRMLTVHGRTRCEFFKGMADWRAVRAVVDAVRVPVIVNGDITSPADALLALEQSGAAGVMVGRGAYGAPWMPGRIARVLAGGRDNGAPPLAEQAAIACEHVARMLSHYGSALGLRNARKHIGWYLECAGLCGVALKEWRGKLCTDDVPARVLARLAEAYDAAEACRSDARECAA